MDVQNPDLSSPTSPPIDGSLAAILKTALDAAIVIGSDGRILDWNEAASDIFGWSREEATGVLLSELIIPSRYRENHKKGLQRFLESGAGSLLRTRVEISALRKDGAEFPVELSITPFSEHRGTVFLGFLRDITVRRSEEAALNRRMQQAKLIYEVVSFAAESKSFDEAMSKCLEAVHQLTGWPVGHVYLPSEADPTLLIPSGIWFADDPGRFDRLRQVTSETNLSLGEGRPGRVMVSGLPIWIADVHSGHRFPRVPSRSWLEMRVA